MALSHQYPKKIATASSDYDDRIFKEHTVMFFYLNDCSWSKVPTAIQDHQDPDSRQGCH